MPFEVLDVTSLDRYELLEDGRLIGYATYEELTASDDDSTGTVRDIHHTFVEPELRGHGLGRVMMAGVLELVRAEGFRVVPTCPFVRDYIDQHPDQQDLLA